MAHQTQESGMAAIGGPEEIAPPPVQDQRELYVLRHSIRMDDALHFLQPAVDGDGMAIFSDLNVSDAMPVRPLAMHRQDTLITAGGFFAAETLGKGFRASSYRDWCRGVLPILLLLHDFRSICERL